MASRGSFQKHKKEQARKEKRQQKIDRRQGRTAGPHPAGSQADTESPIQTDDALTGEITNNEHADQPGSNAAVADDRRDSLP